MSSYIGKKCNARVGWAINPVTRIKDSKKKYDRKQNKVETRRIIHDRG